MICLLPSRFVNRFTQSEQDKQKAFRLPFQQNTEMVSKWATALLTMTKRRTSLKLFADEQQRWQAYLLNAVHTQTIDVNKIVGSMSYGRAQELNTDFTFRADPNPPRMQRLVKALNEGVHLPPIEVARIHDEYYVIDGHHRVAAARKTGQLYIDANVREFKARVQAV